MIKIENLTKSYRTPAGRHYVFKDLNIELPTGKSVALIGRNGAGKSTLLRMIGGIDRPDSGSIITNKTISWPVGLSGCQYRSNSDPPCQSKTDPPPLNHSSVVAFVFFWS